MTELQASLIAIGSAIVVGVVSVPTNILQGLPWIVTLLAALFAPEKHGVALSYLVGISYWTAIAIGMLYMLVTPAQYTATATLLIDSVTAASHGRIMLTAWDGIPLAWARSLAFLNLSAASSLGFTSGWNSRASLR